MPKRPPAQNRPFAAFGIPLKVPEFVYSHRGLEPLSFNRGRLITRVVPAFEGGNKCTGLGGPPGIGFICIYGSRVAQDRVNNSPCFLHLILPREEFRSAVDRINQQLFISGHFIAGLPLGD